MEDIVGASEPTGWTASEAFGAEAPTPTPTRTEDLLGQTDPFVSAEPLGALSGERSVLDDDSAHAIGAGRGIFESASAEPLTMEDIVGASAEPLGEAPPNAFDTVAPTATTATQTEDIFEEAPLTMENLVGASAEPITMEDIVGANAEPLEEAPSNAFDTVASTATTATQTEDIFEEAPLTMENIVGANAEPFGGTTSEAFGAEAPTPTPTRTEDLFGQTDPFVSTEPIQREDPLKSPDNDSLFAGSINDPDSED